MSFPVQITIATFTISAHQLLELVAYAAGFRLYLHLRRRWPKGPALSFEQSGFILIAAIFGAIFGSKLLAWAESYRLYWAHRHDYRALVGGKTIVGALLGGWGFVELAKRKMGIRHHNGDIYVFPLLLGMGIGRIGCFLHGLADETYGTETRLPWGVDFGDGVSRHPTQLYEVLFLALLAALFSIRRSTGRQKGCMFSQFLVLYLTYRGIVELIKPVQLLPGLPLSAIQLASVFGAVLAYLRQKELCCASSQFLPQVAQEELTKGTENSRFLELTSSLCEHCLTKVDAKVLWEANGIYLRKFCPNHGTSKILIADDAEYWRKSRNIYKAPTAPLARQSSSRRGCPWDCGLCPEHEQHSCLAVIEITDQCDQACPICYARSTAQASHRTLDEVRCMLDAVVASEGVAHVVQLSGGEPTCHPQFFEILDEVRRRPIRHVMVNTNGQRVASDIKFVERLASYMPGLEVYLQFDSQNPATLREIRGADYSAIREQAVRSLREHAISTTLVVTLKKGVNDNEVGNIIEYAISQPHVRGVTFQPIQAAGRLLGFDATMNRLTLTEVRRNILEQHSLFSASDLVAVPCHTDSLAMGYAIRTKHGMLPLSRVLDPSALLALGGSTICYEQDAVVRNHLDALFSAGASPTSAANTLSQLCCRDSPAIDRELREIDYSNVFRIVIMQFMDAFSLDLRSLKRCCVHIVSRDGRLIPFDTYNLLYRDQCHARQLP